MRPLTIVTAAVLLQGCSSLMPWRKADPAEPVAEGHKPATEAVAVAEESDAPKPVAAKGGVTEEQQLKLARLWARVDELEEEQFRQKERIRVLEKGLTLGLVPEELKQPPPAEPKAKHEAKPKHAPEAKEEKAKEAKEAKEEKGGDAAEGEKLTTGLSKADEEKYQTGLANAHAYYRDGKYGRAIVAYSELIKTFGDKADNGLPQYWIARCWAALGEYESARQQLIEFLKSHGNSPWVPRAKLELARAEWRVGEQESALATLRGIIEQYPYEDATEMAKMELESLGKKLDLHAPTDLPPEHAGARPVARKSHGKKKPDERL